MIWRTMSLWLAAALGAAFASCALAAEDDSPYQQPRHLAAQASISPSEARAHCAPALDRTDATCAVRDYGPVGTVAGRAFFYARYDDRDIAPAQPDLASPRVVIFAGAPAGMLRPILVSGDDPAFAYDKPVIVHSGGQIVLHLPASESGSGNFNHELVYLCAAEGWRDADVTGWLDDLARRLPKGLAVWKGVYPDYAKLTAETPLWRESVDGNCCPTGGRAIVGLQWRGSRLALRSVRIGRGNE